MANVSITKAAIAETMKQLMQEMPFDKITTVDIVNRSGISRKTFYYHFKDKYDLVNWIFSVEIIDGIVEDTSLESLTDCYLKLCRYIADNRVFCRNALNANGQNCPTQYLYGYVDRQVRILCAEALQNRVLTEDDIRFLVEYYYSAFIGVLKAWINSGLQESPETIVRRWSSLISNNLEQYIREMQASARPQG